MPPVPFSGARHFGHSLVAGSNGLLLASLGFLSSGWSGDSTEFATNAAPLKPLEPRWIGSMPSENCYACGAKMIEIQACKFRCDQSGALLDCEDVSGLPR